MESKIFFNIEKKLAEIKKIAKFSDQEIKLLLRPRKIGQAQLKIGDKEIPAWRIIFNNALGPGKGGIRFHSSVSEDEVKSLSFWMMIKNSLAELPYGGAKGGIKFDPKEFSLKELEIISRKFIDAFYKDLGQDKDIPAPDVYTNAQIMAWMLDEYEKKVGHHEPGMITGKPLELHGCSLRYNATAKGGFIITKELAKEFKLNKKNTKVAIQGFGNAGLYISEMLYQEGFNVVAVSDSQGGIYHPKGLDIDKMIETKEKAGTVLGYKSAQNITNEELLELPVDILILAALESQITKDNANKIKSKYIIEIANGPINYEADKILSNRNKIVVPDVLANAGGVIVSYFEWAQNRIGNILDKKYLEALLESKMISSWQKVLGLHNNKDRKIDLRTAAYIIAIKRVIAAEKLRGNL